MVFPGFGRVGLGWEVIQQVDSIEASQSHLSRGEQGRSGPC